MLSVSALSVLLFTTVLMLHLSWELARFAEWVQFRWLRQHWFIKNWLMFAIAWGTWMCAPAIAAPTLIASETSPSLPVIVEAAPESLPLPNLQQGKQLFQQNCTACHIKGQNLIISYKNLEYNTLKTYGMNSLEAITRQVQYGKNVMPAFGEALSVEQIHNIAAYVLQQAEDGW